MVKCDNARRVSSEAARNEEQGRSLSEEKSQSLLLFSSNLHNFNFSHALHGSEEQRTTSCGLLTEHFTSQILQEKYIII